MKIQKNRKTSGQQYGTALAVIAGGALLFAVAAWLPGLLKEDEPIIPVAFVKEEGRLPVVLFLGNSITVGKGLDSGEAYPFLIRKEIESLGLPWKVVNAGISGQTTEGGLRHLPKIWSQEVEVLVLALGANDILRRRSISAMKKNLLGIIDTARGRNPRLQILFAGIETSSVLVSFIARRYLRVFDEVAEEREVVYLENLLEDVVGKESLNQEDGIHPNAGGQKKIAKNVWAKLQPMLE